MHTVGRKETEKLLEDLIAIDSVNPSLVPGGAGEQKVAEHILEWLRSQDMPGRLDQVAPGRPNVIGVLPAHETGEDGPFAGRHGLMLNGHLDIVSKEGMEIEPLVPRIEGDRVYGRGSFDMKGGLVMGLMAMAVVKRSGRKLGRSVLFTGVADEEYASIGTEDAAARYEADAAVVMEPTGLRLNLAHRGFAWVTVETLGRAAHGSAYDAGIDAIAKMGRFLVELEKLGDGYLKAEGHPLVGPPSVHASLIEGGRELSTYPDRCTLQIERRTLPAENPAVIVDELENICSRLAAQDPDFRYRVTLDFTRNGYEIDEDDPAVRVLRRAFKKVTGIEAGYGGSRGWLDSALLGDAGIPTVIFGPDGTGAHSAVEYVSMESIIEGAQVLAEAIVELCSE